MPDKATVRDNIALRRVEVATCFLRGMPRAKIAERVAVSVSTVTSDLRAIRSEWLAASRSRDRGSDQETELRKLDNLEREAWEAWQRSQLPQETSKISGAGSDLKEARRAEKTSRSQVGAVKFLEIVARCIDRRCAILKIPATSADYQFVVQTVDIRQALLMDENFLEYCRHRAVHGDSGQLCLLDSSGPLGDVSTLAAVGSSPDGPGPG